MTDDAAEFLTRLTTLNAKVSLGRRLPNKPLLVLYALGRVAQGEERLGSYSEAEPELEDLLECFGPPRKTLHPEYAYGRLRHDGVWEIETSGPIRETEKGDLWKSDLKLHAAGGFPAGIHDMLRADPDLVNRAAQQLLEQYFDPSMHDDIRSQVGVPRGTFQFLLTRDPRFRREVLRAYGGQCAICGFNMCMGNRLLGLEAAHIRAHCNGGPDKVNNGLALCTLHHKAFDRGAVGLKPEGDRFSVMVSAKVGGDDASMVLDYHRRPIHLPSASQELPGRAYVNWHTKQVFRNPPIAA